MAIKRAIRIFVGAAAHPEVYAIENRIAVGVGRVRYLRGKK